MQAVTPSHLAPAQSSSPKITSDAQDDYENKIGKVNLLTAEQEVHLAQLMEAGLVAQEKVDAADGSLDPAVKLNLDRQIREGRLAKDRMVEANLRLVVYLAARHEGQGMEMMDLIQEGNLGLIRAVEKFDHTLGYRFSTYATNWIRQAMFRGKADQARTIRIPVHMVETMNKVARTQRELLRDIGREPTRDELAGALEISMETLDRVQQYGRAPVSLHTPIGEEGSELGDLIEDRNAPSPVDAAGQLLLRERIQEAFGTMSERESGVLSMRFGLRGRPDMSRAEIAHVYGVSRERVRQVEQQAMTKLRQMALAESWRDYLS